MAGRIFNAIGSVGIGLAVAGSVANSALYNGKREQVTFKMPAYDNII